MSSRWYRLTEGTIRRKYLVTIALLSTLGVFCWLSLRLVTSDTIILSVPRTAPSVSTYFDTARHFGAGILAPYSLLLIAHDKNSLSDDFFNNGHTILRELVQRTPQLSVEDMTGLLVFNGQYVPHYDWEASMNACFSDGGNEYQRTLCLFTANFTNIDLDTFEADSQFVRIQLEVDPYTPQGRRWLKEAREVLKDITPELNVTAHLYSSAASQLDSIDLVYHFLPIEMGVTAAIVFVLMAAAFRSVVVPIRSIFSIVLTITWTYGFAHLIYNEGMLEWLGWRALGQYDGISWFAPVMCFSILTGFGLDYDIFLLTRIVEFRKEGYTLEMALKLAVYKTGGVITAAGCIMAIAFAGLLLSSMPLLNMCSFFIAFSVLFDTFVVRTILVPAAMAILGRSNFWPRKLPLATRDQISDLATPFAST